ncbi:MAG: T9SS type A sorting domain-containing protein [Calditrichaceae bacterium]|nr:T9SS type A sorting domain-containing protein [Calditrichaceae bacterium]
MLLNKTTLVLFILLLPCFAQNDIEDPREAMIRHKQAYYSRAAELLKSSNIQETLNQRMFDARYYKLELQISYYINEIDGKVTVVFTSLMDNLTFIELNLENSLIVREVAGNAVSFSHNNNMLKITLDKSYNLNEEIVVEIYYYGLPSQVDGRSFQFGYMFQESPMVWTLSQPYGARIWWPCKDSPADKADSVDIIVTVPDNQIVGSNGTLVSETDNGNGTKTFHWHEQYPIATYLVSLVAGEYAHFQDYYDYGGEEPMRLDYYVYPEEKILAQTIFAEMHDYLDALSYYFGPYPFLKEKYGQARYNWGGAMEHQTLTSIGRVSIDWRYIYVHELGHQWFGDLVTCASWSDIWLNEGFASYSEALYAEWAGYGRYPPGIDAYHAYMATQEYRYEGTIHIIDTTKVSNIFNHIVYDKGSWVLHMLRGMMEDSVFFDILKSYASDKRWTYGSVRTDNFKEICEVKSGMDLDNFFNQWLYYQYFPEYRYSWKIGERENNQYKIHIQIEQVQNSIAYDMLIELVFLFSDGTHTSIVVKNYDYSQTYTILLPVQPKAMLFDPDNWILCDAEESDLEKFSSEIRILKMGPNPFPNAASNVINIEIINWIQGELYVDIVDVLGRKIMSKRVLNDHYTTQISWDGRNQNGVKVSSGIYFLHIRDKLNKMVKLGSKQKIIYFNN